MPVPRESMELFQTDRGIALLTLKSRIDMTEMLKSWMELILDELEEKKIDGFILKARSPSCGISGAVVHMNRGSPVNGMGIFAAALKRRFPRIPLVEETDLKTRIAVRSFLNGILTNMEVPFAQS